MKNIVFMEMSKSVISTLLFFPDLIEYCQAAKCESEREKQRKYRELGPQEIYETKLVHEFYPQEMQRNVMIFSQKTKLLQHLYQAVRLERHSRIQWVLLKKTEAKCQDLNRNLPRG